MDTFNLKEAADQSLRLLGQSGVGVKAVKEYQTTGFGAIIRHFTRQGIVDVNIGMLDAFILTGLVKQTGSAGYFLCERI